MATSKDSTNQRFHQDHKYPAHQWLASLQAHLDDALMICSIHWWERIWHYINMTCSSKFNSCWERRCKMKASYQPASVMLLERTRPKSICLYLPITHFNFLVTSCSRPVNIRSGGSVENAVSKREREAWIERCGQNELHQVKKLWAGTKVVQPCQ